MVSRIKQESNQIGPEGGILSSTTVPLVQASFPEGALTKRIRVGLQVMFTKSFLLGTQREHVSMFCSETAVMTHPNDTLLTEALGHWGNHQSILNKKYKVS